MARVRLLAGDLGSVSGSSFYSEELALRLAERGHSVSVVCFRATPRVRDACDVLETGRSPYRDSRVIWRLAYHLDQAHCARALKRASLADVDVAVGLEHMFLRPHRKLHPRAGFVYVPLSLIAPIEIQSYALSPATQWLGARFYRKLQRWALQNADVTVRFTRMSCDELDAYYGRGTARRYAVNPIAVPIPGTTAKRGEQELVRFLSVGRLTASKNVRLAVQALGGLKSYGWRFDIVGEGEDLQNITELAAAAKLENRVRCHGRQPETESWYSNADLLLFTSKLDNCPLVVLEAMSHGVPVLAIRPDGEKYRSGVEELIDHGATGILAANEDDFRAQLEMVLREPGRLIAMGQRARRQIIDNHSWEKHLDRFEELFDEVRPPSPIKTTGHRVSHK